ncbi:hypothetical protein ACN4EG_12385 [Alkalinema pantanalense CENA528]|uniref:hypothetical protein n=1 Tax=Alkalinema pantanalense TaxID=1620705 RepID=UPI003D6F937F
MNRTLLDCLLNCLHVTNQRVPPLLLESLLQNVEQQILIFLRWGFNDFDRLLNRSSLGWIHDGIGLVISLFRHFKQRNL